MSLQRITLGLVCLVAACTGTQREGRSPAFLIIGALEAASGASPSSFSGTLASDVVTLVTRRAGADEVRESTVFEDLARVEVGLALKDPGSSTVVNQPSTTNFITINRYRVRFLRADGRNAAGVDVPFAFDGALTLTVGVAPRLATFVLVRRLLWTGLR
jgi:hypothetical protein